MENRDLTFLVIGAGTIGGITASLLKREITICNFYNPAFQKFNG
jgi:hypothetical protein